MPHMQIYQAWSLVQDAEGKSIGKNATLGKEVSQQHEKYSEIMVTWEISFLHYSFEHIFFQCLSPKQKQENSYYSIIHYYLLLQSEVT